MTYNDAPLPVPSFVALPFPGSPYYKVNYDYKYITPCGHWCKETYISNGRYETEDEARKYMARVIERANENPGVELSSIVLLFINPGTARANEYSTLIEELEF